MSAQGIEVFDLSVTAAGPIVANRAVTAAGANAATDIYGIAKYGVNAAGFEVPVAVLGTCAVEAGGAIPAGTKYVVTDALGRAIAGGTVGACLGKVVRGQYAVNPGDMLEIVLSLTV